MVDQATPIYKKILSKAATEIDWQIEKPRDGSSLFYIDKGNLTPEQTELLTGLHRVYPEGVTLPTGGGYWGDDYIATGELKEELLRQSYKIPSRNVRRGGETRDDIPR